MQKQDHLRTCITDKRIRYTYHDAKVSFIEAVLARGDRRLAPVIEAMVNEGAIFDAWDEGFDYEHWISALDKCGVDPDFYSVRGFGLDEVLPWDIIDCGVTKEFLLRERNNG